MLGSLAALAVKQKIALLGLAVLTSGGGVAAVVSAASAPAVRSLPIAGLSSPAQIAGSATVAGHAAPASPTSPAAVAPVAPAAPAGQVSHSTVAPPPHTATTATKSSKVVPQGVNPAAIQVPAADLPAILPAVASNCSATQRLTDSKITWLLDHVIVAGTVHPELASGVASIQTQLQALLGKNLCAADAQPAVTALCANPAALQVFSRMVSDLPFFIRPLVPSPCSTSLASALDRMSPFMSGV